MLSKKAEDNFVVATWAEQNKKYDVAISRYYYELFQKVKSISQIKGFYIDPPAGKDSHIHTIDRFAQEMDSILSAKEKAFFKKLKRLKDFRKIADYKDKLFTENEFNTQFKINYMQVKSSVESARNK